MRKFYILLILFSFIMSSNAQVSMKKKDDGILITDSGEKVLFYQIDPKGKNGEYIRNNYIHPLWGPDGAVLTEDFPADHLHHRGIFWAWHQVWIGDKRVGDPWEIKNFEQDVIEVEFMANQNGTGVLKTEVLWKSDKWWKSGKKVPYMREKAKITVHPENGNYRKIDFEIRLLAMEEKLKIGGSENEKGYGGFSVRMKLPDDVKFAGPNGYLTPEVTAVESDGYVNVSGSVGKNQQHGGIVIVDHTENPDYPQPWILRAKHSMQNPAWPGREAVTVSTTEPTVLRYSLIVYSRKLKEKKIKKILYK